MTSTPVKTRVATHRARKKAGLVQAGPYWVRPKLKQKLDRAVKRATDSGESGR